MDQAAFLSILGGLYDKLVADVAARVKQDMTPEIDIDALRQLVGPLTDERIKNWVAVNLEDWVNDWAADGIDSVIENWVENNLDLEDAAREAVQNSDHLADLIRETVKNDLTFTVSVD